MAIGKIQFNKEGVKCLTLSEFKKHYETRLGARTEETYYELSGKTKPKKKSRKTENE